MFAVVNIHAKKLIDAARFFRSAPRKGYVADAFNRTTLSKTPELINDIVYWDVDGTTVLIVYPDGPNGLQLHVENHYDAASLSRLKRVAEKAYRIVKDIAKSQDVQFDDVRISIFAEEREVVSGQVSSFWRFMKAQFFEKLLTTFLVSIGASLVGLVLGIWSGSPLLPAWTFTSTMVALLTRTVIESVNYKGAFHYDES